MASFHQWKTTKKTHPFILPKYLIISWVSYVKTDKSWFSLYSEKKTYLLFTVDTIDHCIFLCFDYLYREKIAYFCSLDSV